MELLNIPYTRYSLPNGLEVILHSNNNLPLVAVNVWYKVGSAYEKKGKTGLAHLFEHMMFQGSANVPKEMHFRYIQEAGGTLNGSTNFDRTNYFEKLPSNELELALWLESDRMGYLLEALDQQKLDNQKSVVYNERLERYDNQPYGLAWELIISNLFPGTHPYSWSTIGSLEDIQNYTLEDVTAFFKKYYSPTNATLVVAGDIELNKATELINKYFSSIKSSEKTEQLTINSVTLGKEKNIVHPDNVQLERIYLAWHSDKVSGEDDASLDILSDILAGSKNSRLYKKLVFELETAQDVSAMQFSGKFAGMFMIIATAKPRKSLDDLKKLIDDEIQSILKNGVTERELEKSKNGIKSGFVYGLQNLDNLADHLNQYNFYLNEPNSFNYDLNRYTIVTNDNIKGVVEKYFTKPRVELRVIPKEKK